ncbi:hypothetical protein LJB92_03790, partial [Bacteroidales bacterium OttesenSCG-928-M06]|nr:hypothetical protein [Bacteroidales bacterium OttesenSCG-928-M06]
QEMSSFPANLFLRLEFLLLSSKSSFFLFIVFQIVVIIIFGWVRCIRSKQTANSEAMLELPAYYLILFALTQGVINRIAAMCYCCFSFPNHTLKRIAYITVGIVPDIPQ